ncbi:hypothetical protein SDC9_185065 [bioreactor metagenome]|uniref:Uncharacterized protein n=1 Tax=bioreactor metagenome TaxID=1076179 RepID=A0A645HET5_9ZZZZ
MHLGGQVVVDDVHHLLEGFHHAYLESSLLQVLGHLQTDEAAADDHCAFGGGTVDFLFDLVDV